LASKMAIASAMRNLQSGMAPTNSSLLPEQGPIQPSNATLFSRCMAGSEPGAGQPYHPGRSLDSSFALFPQVKPHQFN
jgi:hypothetical protein